MDNNETPETNAPLPPSRALRVLLDELGVDNVDAALEKIRGLKEESIREQIISPVVAESSAAGDAVSRTDDSSAMSDARKMLEKFRAFSSRIDGLNSTIASMEDQLRHLYADRERLEKEIGASEVEDVIAAFSARALTIGLLEAQLSSLYADREYLETEIGNSDPIEIVSVFKNVSEMVRGAHKELAL